MSFNPDTWDSLEDYKRRVAARMEERRRQQDALDAAIWEAALEHARSLASPYAPRRVEQCPVCHGAGVIRLVHGGEP